MHAERKKAVRARQPVRTDVCAAAARRLGMERFAISLPMAAKNLQQIDRLSEWLRLRKTETGWSFPEIARRSGGLLSQGTPSNVINKRYDTVDTRTIKGLAKAFEITEPELWDIVNGVTPIDNKPAYETREVKMPSHLWRLIDDEAKRKNRAWNGHLEAIFEGYFGGDPNIVLERLRKIRGDGA
jgi:transcriptional regulator with XRE-family HTH domain